MGKVKDLYKSLNNKYILTLELENFDASLLDELKDKIIDIVLSIHKEKRSLNANALLWKLCNELGNKLRLSKEEVYLNALRNYGQSELVSVMADVDVKGYFKYYDKVGDGAVKGKDFTHYKVYKGSSEYDTSKMSILLDGVVSDAKEQGIQVLSASELDLIKREWGS